LHLLDDEASTTALNGRLTDSKASKAILRAYKHFRKLPSTLHLPGSSQRQTAFASAAAAAAHSSKDIKIWRSAVERMQNVYNQ